jgi:GAF domain-containing protein
MPVFNADNELIGVMQLVNKRKLGNFPEYNPDDWPVPPEVFQASFSPAAEKLMSAFNVQVAVALQNAKLFETLKQQEQIQGELFRVFLMALFPLIKRVVLSILMKGQSSCSMSVRMTNSKDAGLVS